MTRDEMERLIGVFRNWKSFRDETLVILAKIILIKAIENDEEPSDHMIARTESAIRFDGYVDAEEIDDMACLLKMVDDELIDRLTLKKKLHEGFPITFIEFHATRKGFNEAVRILTEDADKHGQHTSKMA